jgi:hypothetical protein
MFFRIIEITESRSPLILVSNPMIPGLPEPPSEQENQET